MTQQNVRKSLLIVFFSSNGATAINFLVSIVLARLLTPAEIGVFSIAAVLTVIAHMFRDFGVGAYIQREKNLTPEKIRAASGVLITSSWVMALFLFSASGYAADYFGQPGVRSVVRVLALGFVFIPLGAVTNTLLTRELRAREQAIVNAIATAFYASSSILLAYLGFSYMTMAWANLINIIVTGLAFLPFRPKDAPWMPSFRGWKDVVGFGSGTILGNVVNATKNAIADVVLGKLSGPHDVAIMSRSMSTINIFSYIAGPTVRYAVLPILARKHHAGELLTEPLAKAVAYLTVCSWPAVMLTAIYAHEIVQFLYGSQWMQSVPIVRIMCGVAVLLAPLAFSEAALMAIGRPYLAAIPGLIELAWIALFLMGMYDGSVESFAYALFAASAATYPVCLWLQRKYLDFSVLSLFRSTARSAIVTMLVAGTGLLLHEWLIHFSVAVQLMIAGIVLIPLWARLIEWVSHPFREELRLIGRRFPIIGTFL